MGYVRMGGRSINLIAVIFFLSFFMSGVGCGVHT
jgi:hypothetical protein